MSLLFVIPAQALGYIHIFLFYFRLLAFFIVMAGLDPAIQAQASACAHVVGQDDFTS